MADPEGSGGGGVSGPAVDGNSWGKSIKYIPLVAAYADVIPKQSGLEYLLIFRTSHAYYAYL